MLGTNRMMLGGGWRYFSEQQFVVQESVWRRWCPRALLWNENQNSHEEKWILSLPKYPKNLLYKHISPYLNSAKYRTDKHISCCLRLARLRYTRKLLTCYNIPPLVCQFEFDGRQYNLKILIKKPLEIITILEGPQTWLSYSGFTQLTGFELIIFSDLRWPLVNFACVT